MIGLLKITGKGMEGSDRGLISRTVLAFARGNCKKSRRALVKTVRVSREIQIGHHPDTREKSFRFSQLARLVCIIIIIFIIITSQY
jgi:hypothetical protein